MIRFNKMSGTLLKFSVLFSVIIHLSGTSAAGKDESSIERYLKIEKRGRLWQEGLFGSSSFHERVLDDMLASELGKEIETPHDYFFMKPGETGNSYFICTFYYTKWIHVKAYITDNSYKEFITSPRSTDDGWVKSGRMISIRGRLKNFTLDSSSAGKCLILIVDKAVISEQKKRPSK